jgi:predicted nucleotidyltransferase
MDTLGETIRRLRKERKLPLRTVATFLDIDQAILSKIERGQRRAVREQVVKLAAYFNMEEEDLLIAWLSDKLVREVANEEIALKALQVAEEKVEYKIFRKIDRNQFIQQIKNVLKTFKAVRKAWIYGSFARGDDGPKSDIDIVIETDQAFSYFDLADIQYRLENKLKRKIDVGFIDSFKPYIWEHVKPDLKLIYEKGRSSGELKKIAAY